MPVALGWILWLEGTGQGKLAADPLTTALIVLAGAATAIPLLLFTAAAKRLPYSTLGFLQYVAPSIQFLLAVIVIGEQLTTAHAICFGAIWPALLIFAVHRLRPGRAPARARPPARTAPACADPSSLICCCHVPPSSDSHMPS